jgi:RND family efflux transporter MFP subunit
VEPTKVTLAQVQRRVVAPPIRAVGVSVAKDPATLAFKIGGVVASVRVHAGDRVKKGELLASLNTAEVDAQVRQAAAALAKAERDAKRAKTLIAAQAIPQTRADDAETALEVARQSLRIARFNQQHAKLWAESDGKVARRMAEPGMVVGAGTPIVQLERSGKGYVVRAGLVDRDLVRVGIGDAAEVTLDAYPGKTFTAKVSEVSVEPSPVSGIYDVELTLNSPPHLVTGLVAKVAITPHQGEEVALVPVEALVEGDGRSAKVFTVDADGKAKKVPVTTAFLWKDEVAVRSGLEGVSRVVAAGAPYLTEGAKVREVAR